MFLAMVADGQTTASLGEGRKTPNTHPESFFGWVLIGWALGWGSAKGVSIEWGQGSETFLERKWVPRRFPGAS